MDKEILSAKKCPYCNKKPELTDSAEVYGGRSYGPIYLCRGCHAWVGVHKGSNKALGRLANKQLRKLKKTTHFYFDQIWKRKIKSRKGAYSWLSKQMNIPEEVTHIGMFDSDQCKKAIGISKSYLNGHSKL